MTLIDINQNHMLPLISLIRVSVFVLSRVSFTDIKKFTLADSSLAELVREHLRSILLSIALTPFSHSGENSLKNYN